MTETTINTTPQEKYRTFRLLSVLTFIVYPIFFVALRGALAQNPMLYTAVSVCLSTGSLYAWYFYDTLLVGYPRKPGTTLLIILIAAIGVPYYLFKSRPRRQFWPALALAALILFCQIGVSLNTVPTDIIEKTSPFSAHLLER